MCRFLRNPTELKNIKNISLLRQQMSPTRPAPPTAYNSNSTNVNCNSNTHQATSPPSPVQMIKVEPDLDIDDNLEDPEDMPTDLSMMSSQSQRRQQDQQAAATDLSSYSSERGHFITPEVSITSKYVRELDSPAENQNSAYPLSFSARPNETADSAPFPLTLPRRSEPAPGDSEESK